MVNVKFISLSYANESSMHMIFVYEIYQFLKKFTNKINLYRTVKPDLVFDFHGEKYAIEVETGRMYESNKKELELKVQNLNKLYKKNWFFVLTDRNFVSRYREFGTVVDKRFLTNYIMKLAQKRQ